MQNFSLFLLLWVWVAGAVPTVGGLGCEYRICGRVGKPRV